ncbi:argininosuccinate lyase [Rhodobaculum claviforme]|uniref:argininosuccinate lyase n=1 Tax=Rhodobaculum claviforme TaxID=1549854 RepID=UPI0019132E1B|nr:argininosuccinate lyase [Rhodobaculum claviforme]
MKKLLGLLLLLVVIKGVLLMLSGCGVASAPEQPAPPPGLSVSGEARVGISGRF